MSTMADDWSEWATACARRETRTELPAMPAELVLTGSTVRGERAWLLRVDVASGTLREDADVLPFRRPTAALGA